jgi:ribose transport system ATP-binding protein
MSFAVRGLRKSYGGVEVLKGVDLAVADGEIHALLGANGAGKSTLIKCLSGGTSPDSGEMIVGGRSHATLTPREAKRAGIAVIHQELSLALSLSASDNIFLGNELAIGPFVRRRAQRAEAARWLDGLGIDIDPDADLSTLGNAELQSLEIVKALRSDPKVLILDEPTAALSEQEAENLGRHLLALKRSNLPVLYVTHRLAEVFALADRVSVLRGGEVVLTGAVADLDHDQIVRAVVGRPVERSRAARRHHADAKPVIEVEGLVAPRIGPLDFSVHAGEIVGVFGLVGSGRTELLEALFGAIPTAAGAIRLDGSPYAPRDPAAAVMAGVALVPSDRLRKSIIGGLSAGENMLLPWLWDLSRWGWRRRSREVGVFNRTGTRLNLQPRRSDLEARRYSGGNQQKLVIGRWLNEVRSCRVLMLDEPTQGVDVGARRDIYEALRSVAATTGTAVIVTSSEPEELMQLADRVIVLSGGRIAGTLSGAGIDETRLTTLAHRIEHEKETAA